MEATGVSRRQQLLPAPPSSSQAPPPDLVAPKDSVGSGHSDQARASPSLPHPNRAFRLGLMLVACLSLPTLAVVSGASYRPSLAFLSGIYGGGAALQQPQQRSVEGQELDFESLAPRSWEPSFRENFLPYGVTHANDEGVVNDTREIINSGDPSPSTSLGNVSDNGLPNNAMAAPSPTSDSSDAQLLHNGVFTSSPPPSAGKLPQVELQNGTAASPPPSTAMLSSSEAAHTLTLPGGEAQDKLLGGLLAAGFDEKSCLSRYQSTAYRRKASPYKPSPFLVESLRRYEALHARCGPYTDAYNKALLQLKPRHGGAGRPQCKYLVWTPENGLGNRMVSLVSAFLYALLADRVLLIDRSKDLGSLFCEPFPGSTWLLPLDFPLKLSATLNQKHPQSYGNMLRTYNITSAAAPSSPPVTVPAFVYAHLSHDYDSNDKRFYCERDQHFVERVPLMLLKSDQYFAPALFLVPAFRGRLGRMFPEKEAVFHHLGRYLFHPSNEVWDLITDYYKAHLAGASERLGIQIRLHFRNEPPLELVVRQILNCTWTQKLLPDLLLATPTTKSSKAVLLTSLHAGFLGRLKGVYHGHAAVSFHQPSHEGRQQTGREAHDAKALAEMYLLSMADELVTSVWSTFGYVAQGLGGRSPWILRGPVHTRVPEPACVRAVSMEPCFHYPPNYDCTTGGYADTRRMLPFTRKCRDRKGGLKMAGGKTTI